MTDNFLERIESERTVQLPDGTPKKQIEFLLDRPDADAIVKAVDPPVLYALIQNAGWDQASELIPYVSPQQLQVCIDLDCWKKDDFSTRALEPWLNQMISETNDTTFVQMSRDLDPEILAMYFKENLIVGVFDEEGDVPELMEYENIAASPDGVYALVFPDDEETSATLRRLIDRLYELDRVLAWTLLEACRWELMGPMEHEARRWRASRLEEYGYVTRDEAFEIYKILAPVWLRKTVEDGEYTNKLPIDLRPDQVPVVASVRDESAFFFFQALDRVEDDELVKRLSMEFIGLQNRAAIADGVEPGDAQAASDVVERTAGYLSLGLSFLSRDDLARATEVVQTVKLADVFRAGFTAVWTVSRNASKLRHRPSLTIVDGIHTSLIDGRDAELFRALTQPRPTYISPDGEPEVFREQSQLDGAALAIGTIALKQVWAFSIRGWQPADLTNLAVSGSIKNSPDTLTFDLLMRNALANVILEKGDDDTFLNPLNAGDLNQLASAIRQAPWGDDRIAFFEAITGELVVALPGGTVKLATRWLDEQLAKLVDELAPVTGVEDATIFEPLVLVTA